MAAEDTQAAVAAPEEDLSQENLTGASCGKAPDAVSGCPDATLCGEGADTEAGKTPGVGANEAAAASGVAGTAGTAGGVSVGAPVSSRRTMRSPTCSTMFDVNPLIASSLSRAGGLNWGWCLGI